MKKRGKKSNSIRYTSVLKSLVCYLKMMQMEMQMEIQMILQMEMI